MINSSSSCTFLEVRIQRLIAQHLRVESQRAPRHKRGQEHDDAEHRELDARDVAHRRPDRAALGAARPVVHGVDVAADQRLRDRVDDDVGAVQEGHDGAEGADVRVLRLDAREGRLDVGGQGHVAGGPAEGDRDEGAGDLPGLGHLVALRVPEGQVPDDQQGQGVEAQPRHGRLHEVREQEDEGGAEEFAEVGPADHDLRPRAVAEVAARDLWCDAVLQVSVAVECERVTRDQPDELAAREDDLGACYDGREEEGEALRRLLEVVGFACGSLFERGAARVVQIADEEPDNCGESEKDRGDQEREIVAKPRDQRERRAERPGRAGHLVEDVHEGVHAAQLLDVAADNVTRDDAPDQLDHAVGDAREAEHRRDGVAVVIAVVAEVILAAADLVPVGRAEGAAGCGVDDEQDGGENTEDEDGDGEDEFGGEAFDEWGDEDGADALEGLIEALEEADAVESVVLATGFPGFPVVSVRC